MVIELEEETDEGLEGLEEGGVVGGGVMRVVLEAIALWAIAL